MIIPLCSGMERSASTLTWQITKCLAPISRPLNWEPGCEVKEWTGHPQDWPIKRHMYMSGKRAVIYTYRHPIEAFLSLRRCFKSDIGKKIEGDEYSFEQLTAQEADIHAMRCILEAGDVYNQYKRDRDSGRPILFLKYEDYYHHPERRIRDIVIFLLIYPGLKDNEINQILEYTDIKKNAIRADSVGDSFHGNLDESHGMQGQHINTKTWGKPGAALKKYAAFVDQVINDQSLTPLKKMCENLGYEL